MDPDSFFWHDYETFGLSPRRDRPAQFAGVRTDAALNEIGEPLTIYCQPAPDTLPDPEACLLTGILPQDCLARGLPEHAFAAAIERELAAPGTVGVGYNSIRFDDEVTRFLFWRNLIDPYAREWQNGCGRWDLMDVVRCCRALRPEGIVWPLGDGGKPSLKLEHLTRANGLAHDAAHDALSDVRATLALARLIRNTQPRLWDFCLKLRRKEAVLGEIGIGRPFLHVSGRYPAERGHLALVWPLAPHPRNKNEVVVWDLAQDPAELFSLNAAQIRERLFVGKDDLPEGLSRLGLKTIHLNRSPIVVAKLKTLSPVLAARWGIDIAQGLRHAETAAKGGATMAGIWPEVFQRPDDGAPVDVDEDLYGGFLSNADRGALTRLRQKTPGQLANARPHFDDARLEELLFRYRARNFPATLDASELERWQRHRKDRLLEGQGGALSLPAFQARTAVLRAAAGGDARSLSVLAALDAYAASIAPGQPDDVE